MNERAAMDFRAECSQPEKPPLVQRLWRPNTEKRPRKFPQQAKHTISERPRRLVRVCLLGINDLLLFHHLSSERMFNSESTARPISNRRAKQRCALRRTSSRCSGGLSAQRSSKLRVPSTSSPAAKPAPSFSISRQILIRFEIKTGKPSASASTTAIPKFS